MTEATSSSPRFVSLFGMYIVGLEVRTSNRREQDPSTAMIRRVWELAREENLPNHIENAKDRDVMFGAYTRYQSDDTGPYSLIVGVEVEDLQTVPKGMTGITVLAQEYVVFSAEGEMPQAAVRAWADVRKYFSEPREVMRAFTTDFERYDSATPELVEIFIAIR